MWCYVNGALLIFVISIQVQFRGPARFLRYRRLHYCPVLSSVIEVTWRPWIYRSDNGVCSKVRSSLGLSCKRHGLGDGNLWSGKIHLEATSGVKREHLVVNSTYDLWRKRLQPEEYVTGLPARKCMLVTVSGCHFCWEYVPVAVVNDPGVNERGKYMDAGLVIWEMQSMSLSTRLSFKWFIETHPEHSFIILRHFKNNIKTMHW